jgi:hypothetical protein
MSIESATVAILVADATLVAALTGGIYSKQAIGKLGLDVNNTLTPAYALSNQKQVLRPCLIVRERSFVPTGRRVDVPGQEMGGRVVIECWFYAEGDTATGYTAILTARERVYTLLNMKSKAGIGVITFDNRISGLRAEELNNAALLRDDYSIKTKIGV